MGLADKYLEKDRSGMDADTCARCRESAEKLVKDSNAMFVLAGVFLLSTVIAVMFPDPEFMAEIPVYCMFVLLYELYVFMRLGKFRNEYSIYAPELYTVLDRRVKLALLSCFAATVFFIVAPAIMEKDMPVQEVPAPPVRKEVPKEAQERVPDTYRPSQNRDLRPADHVEEDNALLIKSANVRFGFPEGCSEVCWNKQNRQVYDFDLAGTDVRLHCWLQVVFTSEIAKPEEFFEEFALNIDRKLDNGFIKDPRICRISGHKYFIATGRSTRYPGKILIEYETIHKGARLRIESVIPESDPSLAKEVENAVKKIELL